MLGLCVVGVFTFLWLVSTEQVNGQAIEGTWTSHYSIGRGPLSFDKTTGKMWLGADSGLFEFDLPPLTHTRYTKADGLISHGINNIAVDKVGNKWLDTHDGLALLDASGRWATYEVVSARIYQGSETKNISLDRGTIAIDSEGNIWLAGSYYSGGSGRIVGVLKLEVDGDNIFYASDSTDNEADSSDTKGDKGPLGAVQSIFIDEQDTIWIGTVNGVSQLSANRKWSYISQTYPKDILRISEAISNRMVQIEIEQTLSNQPAIAETTLADAAKLSQQASAWLKAKSFDIYFATKSASTKRSRFADVETFVTFLGSSGVDMGQIDFARYAECWSVVDHNIVATFVWWMVAQGYAIETINRKLSTVKVFCELAAKAGCIEGAELALIQTVHGYRGAEAARLNEKRSQTRQSDKKEHSVLLTEDQATQLMNQPNTPQGHRDLLLITLLIEHGLRVSELAILSTSDIAEKEMHFYRPKLAGHAQEFGRHILTSATQTASEKWGEYQEGDYLLRGSRKGGALTGSGMATRSITDRVRVLGKEIGVEKLSAHDCRHYCATIMAHKGYNIRELMDWFGWTSAQTAMRYIEMSTKQERYKG